MAYIIPSFIYHKTRQALKPTTVTLFILFVLITVAKVILNGLPLSFVYLKMSLGLFHCYQGDIKWSTSKFCVPEDEAGSIPLLPR